MGRRSHLAPLEPDAFLRWVWEQGGRSYGPSPIALEDVWFEFAPKAGDYTREMLRRDYIRLAAKVRRNQRMGWDPWWGIER